MKPLKVQLHKLSVFQIAIFLIIVGAFFGVLCSNIFKTDYSSQMQTFESNVFNKIVDNDIDHMGLFQYVLGKNLNSFIVFWLLSLTILGIPYMALKVTSFGFFTGFFISAITMQYGAKGLVLIAVYLFPQGLLYLPIALVCLFKGFAICRTIYSENRNNFGGIVKLIKSNLFLIFLLALALVAASFLEAYPGAYLLKKVLVTFIS